MADTIAHIVYLGNADATANPTYSITTSPVPVVWDGSKWVLTLPAAMTAVVQMPAGSLLEKICVTGDSAGTFNLGTTALGTQILAGEQYTTDGYVYVVERKFNAPTNLYFSGLSGLIIIDLYIR